MSTVLLKNDGNLLPLNLEKAKSQKIVLIGLDASDPAFWQKGLSMIERFIDELEAMEA